MFQELRCTQCGKLLGKKMVLRYGEMKCPRCNAINIFDYSRNLTNKVESDIKKADSKQQNT